MRALIQRVSKASVRVQEDVVGSIQKGLLILLGIAPHDDEQALQWLVQKVLNLRIFEDESGKMNHSLIDAAGSLLVVSQFTLYADCRKGRRPSFVGAAPPQQAEQWYEAFVARCQHVGVPTQTGRFGAHMHIDLCNDGPVTILLDSQDAPALAAQRK